MLPQVPPIARYHLANSESKGHARAVKIAVPTLHWMIFIVVLSQLVKTTITLHFS